MKYFTEETETLPVSQLKAMQSEKLVKQVRHVYDHVPVYRAMMEKKGLKPEDIHGIEDLHKLPFLSKSDLREAYPTGLMSAPMSECVRIHSTSGTTGARVDSTNVSSDSAGNIDSMKSEASAVMDSNGTDQGEKAEVEQSFDSMAKTGAGNGAAAETIENNNKTGSASGEKIEDESDKYIKGVTPYNGVEGKEYHLTFSFK